MNEPLMTAQTALNGVHRDERAASHGAGWLATLRRFLVFVVAGNLVWE